MQKFLKNQFAQFLLCYSYLFSSPLHADSKLAACGQTISKAVAVKVSPCVRKKSTSSEIRTKKGFWNWLRGTTIGPSSCGVNATKSSWFWKKVPWVPDKSSCSMKAHKI